MSHPHIRKMIQHVKQISHQWVLFPYYQKCFNGLFISNFKPMVSTNLTLVYYWTIYPRVKKSRNRLVYSLWNEIKRGAPQGSV